MELRRVVLAGMIALSACTQVGDRLAGDDDDDDDDTTVGSDAGVADAGPGPVFDGAPPPPPPDAPDASPPIEEPAATYHSFEEVEAYLELFADRHPDHVLLDTYGTTTQGRPLYVVKISDNVTDDEDEPELLVNFAMHGDEIITVEAGLMLIYTLAELYRWDPRIEAIVDQLEVYIVPMVSPDSFVARSRYVDGVDPNRDFPYPANPYRSSIGIIMAARELFESHDFVGSLDYHASGEFVLIPYGASFDRPPNFGELEAVAGVMAEVAYYTPVQISHWLGTTVVGASADYYYWKSSGGINLGVEIARSFAPPSSSIPSVADDVVEMTLRFFEQF